MLEARTLGREEEIALVAKHESVMVSSSQPNSDLLLLLEQEQAQYDERLIKDDSFNSTAPTAAPSTMKEKYGKDKDAARGFGWFTLSLVILIAGIALWRLWVWWQRRAERRMQEYRTAQADRVLGDMQMVPNHDMDDNELI